MDFVYYFPEEAGR